jgi:DNA-directed RNA polymerase specialized sigma24 family protein
LLPLLFNWLLPPVLGSGHRQSLAMQETNVTTQPIDQTPGAQPWDAAQLRVALVTAHHIASRGGRRLHLSAVDREDLRQDILLALVERCHHFDPMRGAWSTFTNVLARHVVADRAQAARLAAEPEFVPADLDEFAAGSSATQQDRTDPSLSLDLQRVADELPAEPRTTLRLLGATGDVADAQRVSTQSSAAFYRAISDLRFWLRASGMRPPRGIPRRSAGMRAWEKSATCSVEN